jgi:hypothetical protein
MARSNPKAILDPSKPGSREKTAFHPWWTYIRASPGHKDDSDTSEVGSPNLLKNVHCVRPCRHSFIATSGWWVCPMSIDAGKWGKEPASPHRRGKALGGHIVLPGADRLEANVGAPISDSWNIEPGHHHRRYYPQGARKAYIWRRTTNSKKSLYPA